MIDRFIMFIQNSLGMKRSRFNDKYNDGAVVIAVLIILWALGRFIFGVVVANKDEFCRMKSIGDFLIAPSYTIGCNIGKDRWDVKVN